MSRYPGWHDEAAVQRWLKGQKGADAPQTQHAPAKPRKFRNVPTDYAGLHFGSKREAERAAELQWMEKAGMITDLILEKRRLRWDLIVNGVKIGRYEADSSYRENGVLVVEDVKSKPTKTREYRRNLKWMKALYSIEIREIE